jgi:putative tryptophan/tyrosine transport system substrate-binding protein
MNQKISALAICAMLFALSSSAQAQQPKKVFRLGYLSNLSRSSDIIRAEPFLLALREHGYIEGKNIAIEYRHAEGKRDRLPELAAELVRLKVDIIVAAGGDPVIQAARNATNTIPVVMMGQGSDPVRAGLIESLARPGGNVTGITTLGRELGGKRLELLKDAVPKLASVAVLYDPAFPTTTREVKEDLPVAARAYEMRTVSRRFLLR